MTTIYSRDNSHRATIMPWGDGLVVRFYARADGLWRQLDHAVFEDVPLHVLRDRVYDTIWPLTRPRVQASRHLVSTAAMQAAGVFGRAI